MDIQIVITTYNITSKEYFIDVMVFELLYEYVSYYKIFK